MKKKSNLKVNLVWQILYQIILIMVPLITTPYVSRVLGADLIGDNSYVVTISNYFVMFIMLGINNHGSRMISRIKEDKAELNKKFSSLIYFHFILYILIICIYVILFSVLNVTKKELYWIALLYLIGAFLDINWLYFGLEDFKTTVTRNIIVKIVSIILVFLLVKTEADLWKYALILAASSLISVLYLWIVLFKRVKLVKVDFKELFSHLKPLLILFIPVIAVSIFRYMDKLMLGIFFEEKTQLGYYEQSEKIINVGVAVVTAIGTVMLPHCSALYAKGEVEKAKKIIRYSNLFSAFTSCAISFGFIAISKSLAEVYLGDNFVEAYDVISLLSVTIIFMAFANTIRTHFLIPNERDLPYVLSAILAAIVNFVINIILIPRMGAVGASIGTICAEAVVAFVQIFSARKDLNIVRLFLDYVPFIFSGALMLLGVFLITKNWKMSWGNMALQILLGGSIYLIITMIIFAIFYKNMLKELLKQRHIMNNKIHKE